MPIPMIVSPAQATNHRRAFDVPDRVAAALDAVRRERETVEKFVRDNPAETSLPGRDADGFEGLDVVEGGGTDRPGPQTVHADSLRLRA